MRQIALVWTNCGSEEEAVSIGRKLVKARLAACSNVERIRSIYGWEGQVEEAAEWRLLAKTTHPEAVADFMREAHSFDLPAILVERAEAPDEYADWVAKGCRFPD